MSRFDNESYSSFLRPRWFRIEIYWPTQLRCYHDEGITERKCPYVFFCKPNQLSNECPHVICTLKLHEFDVDALEKRNLWVAPSPRKDVSEKTTKSLPSKQPRDYISPVFYSDYTSVTLFTYIRVSSHPTTALISKHYFCILFCHQETIHLLASRSAIVKPWSWALAGDSN